MTADYIVLRHGLDVPEEYRSERLEGLWLDRGAVPYGTAPRGDGVSLAVAEPSGAFETRDDGAVAEVWTIRLITPNEQREDPHP